MNMMGKKNKQERNQLEVVSLEDLVPKNHLVRKLDAAMDFSFIYEIVEDLYKPYGRESIDPVVLVKIVFIQYIFGIPSMRKTIEEIEVNFAYRWFLGYGIHEAIPHFSTFGKNYTRRFQNSDLFEQIFEKILDEAYRCGFVDDEKLFIDGSHIKANANSHKYRDEVIAKTARVYEEELQAEINADRARHGKKPLSEKETEPEMIHRKVSTTDPECGFFHKGEHKKVFAYTTNTCCERHGFVLDFEAVPGNIHDSVSFWKLYKRICEKEGVKYLVMDAGYKNPAIARAVIEDGKIPVMPYTRPMTKKGFFKKYEYVYDEYYDCYICPENQILKYSTTNREGYREYKSSGMICETCESRNRCTESKNHVKIVTRHVWESYMEQAEDYRHTRGMKQIYQQRKETIERVFADAKEKHGMRYTRYRGLAKVKMELTLLFACMNLKKMANWKWNMSHPSLLLLYQYIYFARILRDTKKTGFIAVALKPVCLQAESCIRKVCSSFILAIRIINLQSGNQPVYK